MKEKEREKEEKKEKEIQQETKNKKDKTYGRSDIWRERFGGEKHSPRDLCLIT